MQPDSSRSERIPYEDSLLAYLDQAYVEGLVEFEAIDASGARYHWHLQPPMAHASGPEFPDTRPWRVTRMPDGGEVAARDLPEPGWKTNTDAPEPGALYLAKVRFCEDAWAERLARTLGHPFGPVHPAAVGELLEASPYRWRVELPPGFRVEKPWWAQTWQVKGPDDRPWSGEHPTLASAVEEAMAMGTHPFPAPAARAWSARARKQRFDRWEADARGCRALACGSGMAELVMRWSVPAPSDCGNDVSPLWERMAASAPTLGQCLAARESAYAAAVAQAGEQHEHRGGSGDVAARLRGDWRAVALADIGLHLFALHHEAQTLTATRERAAIERAEAGVRDQPPLRADLVERFAVYGPSEAERTAIAEDLVANQRRRDMFLAAPNALAGLSVAWSDREQQRNAANPRRQGADPWWIQGWRVAVEAFGVNTLLTDLRSATFTMTVAAAFPDQVEWTRAELIELGENWIEQEGLTEAVSDLVARADTSDTCTLTPVQRGWLRAFGDAWERCAEPASHSARAPGVGG